MKILSKWLGFAVSLLFASTAWSQQTNAELIFQFVEEPPQFVGGADSLNHYLKQHLTYPEAARLAKITGKVMVKFVVERDGQITNTELAWSLGYGCDEEALRVVGSFPKWQAGRQSGRTVRVRRYLPIAFPFK